MQKLIVSSTVALSLLIVASAAHAEEPFTANKLQVGGGLNYGLYMGDDEGDPPNPYGVGLGVDAGYTLGPGVYLGGEFNYFLGGSDTQSIPGFGEIEYSWNVMQYGVEVGYDLAVSPELVVRPKTGIGMGSVKVEVSVAGVSDDNSESGLFIPIGVGLLYSMDSFFLAGDLRYGILNITTEDEDPVTGTTVETDTNVSGLLIGIGAGGAF